MSGTPKNGFFVRFFFVSPGSVVVRMLYIFADHYIPVYFEVYVYICIRYQVPDIFNFAGCFQLANEKVQAAALKGRRGVSFSCLFVFF